MNIPRLPRRLAMTVVCLGLLPVLAACATKDDGAPHDASYGCNASRIHASDRPLSHFLREMQPAGQLQSPATDAYVAALAAPLRAAYGFPEGEPRIYVVPSKNFVAEAMPENVIFISMGVLENTGSAEGARGILAHEMGHLACHHALDNSMWDAADWGLKAGLIATAAGGASWLKGVNQNAQAFLYLGGVGGVAQAGAAEWAYTHAGWSRDQESQADLIGTEMLVRSQQRTNGLVMALSSIPDTPTAKTGGEASAFSGSDHPEVESRVAAINDYLDKFHPDYHDPLPDESAYKTWKAASRKLSRGLDDLNRSGQALGQPLALIGQPGYTVYPERNQLALKYFRMALDAPRWTPDQPPPNPKDPELAALADLTFTRVIAAELRIRMAPASVDAKALREEVFARPDMPEYLALLNSLGYMQSKQWSDANKEILHSEKLTGGTRLDDLYGIVAAGGGVYPPNSAGGVQSFYTLDCTLSADQDFMKQCDEAQKNPGKYLEAWWNNARILPPLPDKAADKPAKPQGHKRSGAAKKDKTG